MADDPTETPVEPIDEASLDAADVAPEDEATPAEPTVEQKLADAEDRALRLQAELQNVLNRTRREIADQAKYGPLGLARDLLPAIDNIDRALEAAAKAGGEQDDALGLIAGFRMVREQLLGVLSQHGCEAIDPAPGEAFDPAFHEAILQQPSDDHESGAVTLVAQTGYRMHDRVVRAAQVIVSSGPAAG